MFATLSELILKYRKPILWVTLVLALIFGSTVPFVTFDFSPQQLFKSTSQRDQLRETVAKHFGREDNLTMLLIKADNIYTPEVLTYVHRLTLDLREVTIKTKPPEDLNPAPPPAGLQESETASPQANVPATNSKRAQNDSNTDSNKEVERNIIKRTESLTTLQLPRTSKTGGLTTKPLTQVMMEANDQVFTSTKSSFDAEMAKKMGELATSEPLIHGRLVDKANTITSILLWYTNDIQGAAELEKIDDGIKQVLKARPPPKGVTVEVGGIPSVRVDVVRGLRMEQLTFIPLTGLVYLLILIFLFRGFTGTVLPLGTVVLSVLATSALLVVSSSSINIINNILPTMIFIIGISDSIHMLTRQAEASEGGLNHQEATKSMIRHTGAACLLTSTTTAVGFVSLLAADTDILKSFGWQAAAGVMFAYIATLFFLPAGLSVLKPVSRFKKTDDTTAIDPLDDKQMATAPFLERYIIKVAHKVLHYPKSFIVLGMMVTSVFVYFGSKVNIDTTLLEIYHEDHPTYKTIKTMEQSMGGILPIEVVVSHKDKDHFKTPKAFANLSKLQQFTKKQPGVLSTQTFVDFHQAARVGLLGDAKQRTVMPKSKNEIVQLHTLIEGPPDSKDGVRSFVTNDFRMTRLLMRIEDFGARRTIVLGEELQAELDKLFPKSEGYTTIIAGDAYVASASLDSFIRDLFYSLLLAMVIIFGMMTIVFRSLKIGLISVLPNAMPLIMTFGYMGASAIDLNTTTIIIFVISLGLAVDDTIHFLARFGEELPRHDRVYDALIHTYFGAGRAIMLTSILLLTGLLVLMLSSFKPSMYFAKLTAFTIFGAIFGDLLILPPILLLVFKKKGDVEKTQTKP